MQFLHAVQCVIFNTFYDLRWIGTYFVYSHWYLKKDDPHAEFDTRTQTQFIKFNFIELINGRSQTN